MAIGPIVGPPGPGAMPSGPLPLMGIAPPPVGPRLPNPQAMQDMRAGLSKLMDASQSDPQVVGKKIDPLIRDLMLALQDLLKPPKPSREEAAGGVGPLDQTPAGDVAGTPLESLIPRLAGVGMR